MGKNGNVPRFFSLPQSSRISFKVPNRNSRRQKLKDGNSIPDDAIPPRHEYKDSFETSKAGLPKIYTPEQIYNYKSQWKRYEKGMNLVESGDVIKGNDDSSYKILSSKAPKGYWEVTKKHNDKGVCLSENVFVMLSASGRAYDNNSEETTIINTPEDPAQTQINNKDFESAALISAEYYSSEDNGKAVSVSRNATRTLSSVELLTDSKNGFGGRAAITATIYTRGTAANKARLKVRITYSGVGYVASLSGVTGTIVSGNEYEIDNRTFRGPTNISFVVQADSSTTQDTEVVATLEILECCLINSLPETTPWYSQFPLPAALSSADSYNLATQENTSLASYSYTYTNIFSGNLYLSFGGSPYIADTLAKVRIFGSLTTAQGSINAQIRIYNSNGDQATLNQTLPHGNFDFNLSVIPSYPQDRNISMEIILSFSTYDGEAVDPANASLSFQIESSVFLEKGIGDTCKYPDGSDGSDDNGEDGGNGGNDGNANNYECDCPDSSKKKYLNSKDTSGNENLSDDWTDSDAGAQNRQCKHIWAVRILRKEVDRIPFDMPIETEGFSGNQSNEPRIIGQQGGLEFDNWNPNKQRRR
ncbi:MAG: hypothetical protein RMZ41_003275 [Nostoc sp. DedVER02]|uniref:hypothetical protein n=1 Tax=unclassified Nostoc TaxID=2593658 RepID=UPI002AD3C137|nr:MULTISPECIES: hypothetical protein [unclassified Nostoc]MDZ7986822.1 hypothetical protein [Nostoc sp. DedVER02]MDZ8115724.1 hypothetical protein [Nostoc sp. DedVER01b]